MIYRNRAVVFAVLATVVLSMLSLLVLGAGGVTVYVRNISGFPVEYQISDSPNKEGPTWVVVGNGQGRRLYVYFGQYFIWRYHSDDPGMKYASRYQMVGEYPYTEAWWKFVSIPGSAPGLEGDPENAAAGVTY